MKFVKIAAVASVAAMVAGGAFAADNQAVLDAQAAVEAAAIALGDSFAADKVNELNAAVMAHNDVDVFTPATMTINADGTVTTTTAGYTYIDNTTLIASEIADYKADVNTAFYGTSTQLTHIGYNVDGVASTHGGLVGAAVNSANAELGALNLNGQSLIGLNPIEDAVAFNSAVAQLSEDTSDLQASATFLSAGISAVDEAHSDIALVSAVDALATVAVETYIDGEKQ